MCSSEGPVCSIRGIRVRRGPGGLIGLLFMVICMHPVTVMATSYSYRSTISGRGDYRHTGCILCHPFNWIRFFPVQFVTFDTKHGYRYTFICLDGVSASADEVRVHIRRCKSVVECIVDPPCYPSPYCREEPPVPEDERVLGRGADLS